MKKGMTILTVVLAAGVASAALWSEDFSVNTHQTSWAFGAQIGDGDQWSGTNNVWYSSGPGVNGSGALVIKDHEDNNKPRAAVISLDSLGLASGNYTLKWDFNLWGGSDMDVQVWDCQAGPTTADWYNLKYADGGVQINQVLTNGTASATQIGYKELVWGTGMGGTNGTATLNFAYDGSGDIGLMFGVSSQGNWYKTELAIDNIEIIPEPATLGLVGIMGIALLVIRRRFSK